MIEKILGYLNGVPDDKVRHAWMGMLWFTVGSIWNIWIGLGVLVVAAVGKEIYDYYHPNHTCDVWDAIATIVGAIPVIVYEVIK